MCGRERAYPVYELRENLRIVSAAGHDQRAASVEIVG